MINAPCRPPSNRRLLLAGAGLSKRYGGTQALSNVEVSLHEGEIVALMGANGAGKSTLVNLISGAVAADAGHLQLQGRAYTPASPRDAVRAGVVTVHQSTASVGAPGLSVADALLLEHYVAGQTPRLLTRRRVRALAARVAAAAGFEFDLDAEFGSLGLADRQLVAIARALAAAASVLILDEPTASLSRAEAERLFTVLRALRERGLGILYVSHKIADLQALADRAVVMRSGRVVAHHARPIDFAAAVTQMIGRRYSGNDKPAAGGQTTGEAVFELIGARMRQDRPSFDLVLRQGEVVAITGGLGAGKSRLLNALFGIGALPSGRMRLGGHPYAPRGPAAAIAAGVGLAAEDRHRSSLLPALWPGSDVAGTISLPHLRRWFPRGWLATRRERQIAQSAIEQFGVRATGPRARIETLSGGNQQKVVLARWQVQPRLLLLLDEPFQSVDVGARADIVASIRAQRAGATLIATSDPAEALEVADRLFVLADDSVQPWHATHGASYHPTAAL